MNVIPVRSHTFMEIDHEIISRIIRLQLIKEGLLKGFVSYKQKYVHEISAKLAQEKVC